MSFWLIVIKKTLSQCAQCTNVLNKESVFPLIHAQLNKISYQLNTNIPKNEKTNEKKMILIWKKLVYTFHRKCFHTFRRHRSFKMNFSYLHFFFFGDRRAVWKYFDYIWLYYTARSFHFFYLKVIWRQFIVCYRPKAAMQK